MSLVQQLISIASELCNVLHHCCLKHVVGKRLDRYEPRVLERRPKKHKRMQKPRHECKPDETYDLGGLNAIRAGHLFTGFQ